MRPLQSFLWFAGMLVVFFSLPVVRLQEFAPPGFAMTQMVLSPAIIAVFALTVWFSIKTS